MWVWEPILYYLFKFHMDQNHWFFILKYPNSIFNPWSGNNCFRNRLDNTFSPNLKSGLLCRFDLKSTWICRGRFHIAIDRSVYVSLFWFYLNLIHIYVLIIELTLFFHNKVTRGSIYETIRSFHYYVFMKFWVRNGWLSFIFWRHSVSSI